MVKLIAVISALGIVGWVTLYFAASAPEREKPVAVTVLPVPTVLDAKFAVPAEMVTTSEPTKPPFKVAVPDKVAVVNPS